MQTLTSLSSFAWFGMPGYVWLAFGTMLGAFTFVPSAIACAVLLWAAPKARAATAWSVVVVAGLAGAGWVLAGQLITRAVLFG